MRRHPNGEPTLYRVSPEHNATDISKRAVRHLLHYSKHPALLLLTMERRTREPEPFPCQDIYAQAAAEGGCALKTLMVRTGEGFSHHLFLVREHGLPDHELMSSVSGA